MKKYLIFDLDWTLIDSHWTNWNRIQDYIDKNLPEYSDNAKYSLKQMYRFSNISKILLQIMPEKEYEKHIIWIKKVLDKKPLNINFYSWAIDLIKRLSKKYDLYLSTWSPEHILEEVLNHWEILDYFKLTKWSKFIQKWVEHIEIFKDYSEDSEFEKYSILIWDWYMDKFIAEQCWIDFIRVWTWILEWEVWIKNISELESILEKH